MNITKINKYKNLNSTSTAKHKRDMDITKIGKYKKLNSTSTTEHKTDMNIYTKINTYKKLNSTSTTEHKTEHHYTLVNEAISIAKSNDGVANLKTPNQQLTSMHYLYL